MNDSRADFISAAVLHPNSKGLAVGPESLAQSVFMPRLETSVKNPFFVRAGC